MSNEFDRFAGSYDEALKAAFPPGLDEDQYYARYKVDFVSRLTKNRVVTNVLDFGCGAGRSLAYLAPAFPRATIFGFDPSTESIKLAAPRFPEATLTADWDVVRQHRFDLILAANVFHHVPRDQISSWLERCRDALTPRGTLFIFEHNPWNPLTRYVFERCSFDVGAKMIPRNELIVLGSKIGLQPASTSFTLFFPKVLSAFRPLERWLGWLPLGAQYCVEFGVS